MTEDLNVQLEKLIKGQAKYQSKNLGLNLIISRVQRKYAANQKPSELLSCLEEIKAFLKKYSAIMANDVEALKKL
ncbi:MAG: hypothetical protein GXZ07_08660 [Firmicutes bacterium]|nr:hypothetical protein [Bacillota bacterium]